MAKITVSGLVEQIFAQAVALDQSGGLRNTIYVTDREIFIINYDHTVLLRFKLRKSEPSFNHPVSFRANDYDSNEFYEKDGKIIFVTEAAGYTRKKTCKAPDMTSQEVKEIFSKYLSDREGMVHVQIPKDVLGLLDRDLSHIEFSAKAGEPLKLIQRNIYSGGVIEIQKLEDPKKPMMFHENIPVDIEPMALRTNDFIAMFNFQDILRFSFHPAGNIGSYVLVKSTQEAKQDLFGVLSGCLYDEIIEVKEAMNSKVIEETKLKRGGK